MASSTISSEPEHVTPYHGALLPVHGSLLIQYLRAPLVVPGVSLSPHLLE